MTLVSMKYSKAEAKEEAKEMTVGNPSQYPWGLQLRLEKDELDKLGVKTLPGVGAEFHLAVVAEVTSVSQQQMADGKEDACVNLQITMMGVQLAESAADEKGEKSTPKTEAAETKKVPSLLQRV